MPKDENKEIEQYKGGILSDLTTRIKLILRLLGDSRISPLLKALPIGSLIYLLFPDLAPGPIDDAAIIWLGAYLFVELCPPEIVQEHTLALTGINRQEWIHPNDDDVVEGEYQERPRA